ncbi:MAG: hypothetical protein RL654_1173 [Pseudomonadota bacterium]|jgi:hypothetical protein
MKDTSIRGAQIAARVLAGVIGSYAFTWGFAAAGVAALVGLGADYHDAEMAVLMLAFLVFPGLLLWCVVARSLLRIGSVLAGGTLLLSASAWAIQHALLT